MDGGRSGTTSDVQEALPTNVTEITESSLDEIFIAVYCCLQSVDVIPESDRRVVRHQ